VHPLATESVTFISDRSESLMGLFYLLTLYCFVEGVRLRNVPSAADGTLRNLAPSLWLCLSVMFCYCGMATKEVMVSAPLLVLLYDRTFVAGTFRGALRGRAALYAGLASSWLLLALLVVAMGGNRGNVAGFGAGVPWWAYSLTQFKAVALYVWLSFWPHPLVFDYGRALVGNPLAVLPQAIFLLMLVAGTVLALRRRSPIGFLGAWFLAILAPSSSIVPLASQTMAEHRMYLPLAAVVVISVVGIHRLLRWAGMKPRAFVVVALALAAGLGFLTEQRNEDYRSELGLWEATVRDYPGNGYAHYNLAVLLEEEPGRLADAMSEFRAAIRLEPGYAPAHNDLGNALVTRPEGIPEAIVEYKAAIFLQPGYAEAHNNLGMALSARTGSLSDAILEFQTALRLRPDYAEAHINLGNALSGMPGRLPDAIAEYEAALRVDPDSIEAHFNLGNAFVRSPGRTADALREYQEVLRIRPGFGPAKAMLQKLGQAGFGGTNGLP
jgi:tetratricopeptide (TPR) repeat protein